MAGLYLADPSWVGRPLFAFAEQFEILLGLFSATARQSIVGQRVGRFGAASCHFLFDGLGHIAFDVGPLDEAAKCGGAFSSVLPNLSFASVRGVLFFRPRPDPGARP